MISLEDGSILSNHGDAEITLLPNTMLSQSKNSLVVQANPASREVRVGDFDFCQGISQYHQVSRDLILIQRKERSKYKLRWNDWVLLRTNGSVTRVPSELETKLMDVDSV